jgi:hypothetical protein
LILVQIEFRENAVALLDACRCEAAAFVIEVWMDK